MASSSDIESNRSDLSGSGELARAVLYNNPKNAATALARAGVGFVPTGVILPFAGGPGVTSPTGTTQAIPDGWLLCSNVAVSRTVYSNLFSVIGTQYGVGDGSTTFNVPDLRGRAPHGKDDMGGTASNRVTNAVSVIPATQRGAVGGNEYMQTHLHSITSLQGYNRYIPQEYVPNFYNLRGGAAGFYAVSGWVEQATYSNGNTNNNGSGASQNMPPTIITNYIINT